MTRTTKIIFSLIVSLGVLYILYLLSGYIFQADTTDPTRRSFFSLFTGDESGTNSQGGDGPLTGEIPALQESRLKELVSEPVIGISLSNDGARIRYYKKAGGNVFQRHAALGTEERMGQLTILGLQEVLWSSNGSSTLVSYLDGRELKRFIHQVATSSTILLPRKTSSVSWSGDGKEVAYTEVTDAGILVKTMTALGRNPRTILTSLIPDWRVQWGHQKSLILQTSPSYLSLGMAEIVAPGKTRGTLLVKKRGLGVLPAQSKGIFAVSSVNERGELLPIAIINDKGVTVATSDAPTLAEKCVWNAPETELYCAVPQVREAELPDKWYRGETIFGDALVKIDAATGKTELLLRTGLDAIELTLAPDASALYFIDKPSGSLWQLKLK